MLVGRGATVSSLLDVGTSGAVTGTRQAGCDTPLAQGLSLRARDADGLDGADCFGGTLGRVGGTWTMTSPGSLTNTHVLEADNAAVGLRLLGKEVEYVRFPGESHELTRSGSPRHRVQRAEIVLEWFARKLGAPTA